MPIKDKGCYFNAAEDCHSFLYKRAEWYAGRTHGLLYPGVGLGHILVYACPAWEFAADTHLLKLQRLQNRVLRSIGNFPWPTPVRELHKAFSIPYVYDYMTKLSRQQAEVIQNHENTNVRNFGQGEARHRKYKRLKLGGGQAYDRSSDQAAVVA
jgi:hypothetical protein